MVTFSPGTAAERTTGRADGPENVLLPAPAVGWLWWMGAHEGKALTVPAADGRVLEVLLLGPEDGVPIFFHHGTPGAAGIFEALVDAGSSGGAPHAIARAALVPERVISAAPIASPAPIGAEGLDWTARVGRSPLEVDRRSISGSCADYVIEQFRHSLAGGVWGWFDDDRALGSRVAFSNFV